MEYDTSLKIFRKVYKDCQLSYNGNRYKVPHEVVTKKVMLKVKGDTIRIYYDQDLLATYQEPPGKGQVIGDPRIYERLKRDQAQLSRKYGQSKGKATRGLSSGSLFPQVALRPLTEYEQFAAGGVQWNN